MSSALAGDIVIAIEEIAAAEARGNIRRGEVLSISGITITCTDGTKATRLSGAPIVAGDEVYLVNVTGNPRKPSWLCLGPVGLTHYTKTFILENYFTVGTFGLTTSIGTQIDAIASTAVALGSGTKELVLTVGGLLARSVTTGGALILPRLDGANLVGPAPYAYTKSALTAFEYAPVYRQFVVSGVSSGSHNVGLQFRGDNTAGDTYLTNAFVYITARVTG